MLEKLLNTYEDLIDQVYTNRDQYSENITSVFAPAVGKDYNEDLMIVGRAVNGWHFYLDKERPENKQELLEEIGESLKNENLDWVSRDWGDNEANYNPKKSAFWRVSKEIARYLIESDGDILDRIVWTNLYKVSKADAGNPSTRLKSVQKKNCIDILKQEMNILKPKVVVFLTGMDWAHDFVKNDSIKSVPIPSTNNYVQFMGYYNDQKIIVGQHPQGKPEGTHLHEIIQSLKFLNVPNIN
ncbi:MAG: hypothetical protein N4A41_01020 [Crocinitomicaceae bacterium]|jgi:hypothetical protein|nr:hypothetical protein [Crocinitomicaceae bacterium]